MKKMHYFINQKIYSGKLNLLIFFGLNCIELPNDFGIIFGYNNFNIFIDFIKKLSFISNKFNKPYFFIIFRIFNFNFF